jgi:hypothetical protein
VAALSPNAIITRVAPVVIINEAMGKCYWPKSDPFGDRIVIGKGMMPEFDAEPPRQIIGIIANQRDAP